MLRLQHTNEGPPKVLWESYSDIFSFSGFAFVQEKHQISSSNILQDQTRTASSIHCHLLHHHQSHQQGINTNLIEGRIPPSKFYLFHSKPPTCKAAREQSSLLGHSEASDCQKAAPAIASLINPRSEPGVVNIQKQLLICQE